MQANGSNGCLNAPSVIEAGGTMNGSAIALLARAAVIWTMTISCTRLAGAQGAPQDPSAPAAEERPSPKAADVRRSADLPLETYAVTPGTKFLVRLENELDTKGTRENSTFKVKTLEPLEAGSGIYLPPGAEIHGHVSRVESAGIAGRARIWLTFDEVRTKFGQLPIVAEVVSVPGDHSVRTGGAQREGLIEGRTSTQRSAAEAAAAGAAIGAVRGVKDKDKKEAAEGAAAGAIAAYLMESGRGHELDLPKGAKLELELERALYLLKE
jgi:YMGG-like Gly-zipper